MLMSLVLMLASLIYCKCFYIMSATADITSVLVSTLVQSCHQSTTYFNSLQTRSILWTGIESGICLDEGNSYCLQYASRLSWNHLYSCFTLAIVAFLLVSASFVIGLKCYLDFDRGLLESKVNSELSFDTIHPRVLKHARCLKAFKKDIIESRKYAGISSWHASHSPDFDWIAKFLII